MHLSRKTSNFIWERMIVNSACSLGATCSVTNLVQIPVVPVAKLTLNKKYEKADLIASLFDLMCEQIPEMISRAPVIRQMSCLHTKKRLVSRD